MSNLIKRFKRNIEGNDYVVGDIHGNFDMLNIALMEIGFNHRTDRLFSTGDLVDRGKYSWLAHIYLQYTWFESVQGNHDERVTRYKTANLENWYTRSGGEWHSFLSDESKETHARLFEEMPTVIEIETVSGLVGIIHADCPTDDWNELEFLLTDPSLSMQAKKNAINNCRWSRKRFNMGDEAPSISNIDHVYFGHSTVPTQVTRGNCTYIDTASKDMGGKFTIIKL